MASRGWLIDAYENGLLDKGEFEPRIRAAKERLVGLEAEAQAQAAAQLQEEELRLVISHIQDFAERVKSGLAEADWQTRREIIHALVKRVEVSEETVQIVYRVDCAPFVKRPEGGDLQDCVWRSGSPGRVTAQGDPATLRRADRAPGRCSAGGRAGARPWRVLTPFLYFFLPTGFRAILLPLLA